MTKLWRIKGSETFPYGIAEDPVLGPGFANGEKLEIRQKPGKIYPGQTLIKSSGTTITELVTDFANAKVGTTDYLFGISAGNIWRGTGAVGGWTNLSSTAGGKTIEKYGDYLYYPGTTDMGRYGPLSGTPAVDDTWLSATIGSSLSDVAYHPSLFFKDKLWIGNGQYVASWDGTTWTSAALDIKEDYVVKILIPFGSYLGIIAEKKGQTRIFDTAFFLWDMSSTSWNDFKSLGSVEVYSAVNYGGIPYLAYRISPSNISFGYFNGSIIKPIRSLATLGSADTDTLEVYTGAMSVNNGLIYIGITNSSQVSPKMDGGLYSVGTLSSRYPVSLNFDSLTSYGYGYDIVVGAIGSLGSQVFVAYIANLAGTTEYAIDQYNTQHAFTAYFESLVFDGGRPGTKKQFKNFKVYFEPLPANTSVVLKCKVDYATSWTTLGTASTEGDTILEVTNKPQTGRKIQLRVEMTRTATAGEYPVVTDIATQYHVLPR